jgi:two-component system sensor histidine kinase AtoS
MTGGQAAAAIEALDARLAERGRLSAASRTQYLAMAGQLAASVAHEVRNPLATISSSVEYALNSSSDWASKTEVLRDVMGEIDRINRTLSGMLSLSRPQPPELRGLDLGTVVEEALLSLQPYVDHHQISLVRASASPVLPVQADASQLRQVLLNVLLNACQATLRGGSISVLTKLAPPNSAADSSRAEAIVVITDSGCGIPTDQRTQVFEPFFTTKPSGTGLGLSTSLEIMKAHGGWIRVESGVGHGTTVVLTLPLREA